MDEEEDGGQLVELSVKIHAMTQSEVKRKSVQL